MLSSCLRKLAKPAGGQCLPEACRPQRPSPRAPGTMRKIAFHCGLLESLETWILTEGLKETISYCAISDIMGMSWTYSFLTRKEL